MVLKLFYNIWMNQYKSIFWAVEIKIDGKETICPVFEKYSVYTVYLIISKHSDWQVWANSVEPECLGDLVRLVSDWWSGGHGLDSCWIQQHSFMDINHEVFSVLLIQEEQTQAKECAQVLGNSLQKTGKVWLAKLTVDCPIGWLGC